VQAGHNFIWQNKALEKPWACCGLQDMESMCSLASGKKMHLAEVLPDFHKRALAERHPDRL